MSLRIEYPSNDQLVRVGWHFTNTTRSELLPQYGTGIMGYQQDPGFSVGNRAIEDPLVLAMQHCIFRSRVIPASRAFGFSVPTETPDVTINGSEPAHYLFNAETDRRRHGGFLTGLYTCIHLEDSRHHVVVNERETTHLNFHGAITASQQPGYHALLTPGTTTATVWNVQIPKFSSGNAHRYGVWNAVTRRFTSTTGSQGSNYLSYYFVDEVFAALIDHLDPSYSQVLGDTSYRRQYWLRNLVTEWLDDTTFQWYTQWTVRGWVKSGYPNGRYFEVEMDRTSTFHLEATYVAGNPDVSGNKSIPFGIRYSVRNRINKFTYGNGLLPGADPVADWIKRLTFQPVSAVRTSYYSSEGQAVCSTFGQGTTGSSHDIYWDGRKLAKWYHDNSEDLYPAVFYSTADALSKYTDVVSANHIETLSEFGDVIEMVKNLGNLIKFFRALRHLDIQEATESGKKLVKQTFTSRKGLRRLLDTSTGRYLALQFGVLPLLDGGKEFVEEYDNVVDRLYGEGKWGKKILYGEFRYDDLPDSVFGPVSMRVHTKTCLGFEDTTLLTLIFSASALGVMPGLSALWECVPWSFAIDWFTNMSQRMEDIDNQMLLFLLEHYYSVHSIKLIAPLSDEYLSDGGYTKLEDSYVTYYHRWLSHILPTLRPSRFDYRAPSGELPRTIIGCLTWQVVS